MTRCCCFEVLYGAFVANVMAFNADVSRDIAAHVLELAEKQSASFPRVLGHNHLGGSLMLRGEIAEARAHLDQAIALYDPAEHRSLATRFGEDQAVATLSMRPWVLWLLGYPEAALRDTDDALKNARETGQAASLMFALHFTAVPLILCGDYSRATALAQELCALADEKDAAVLEGQRISVPRFSVCADWRRLECSPDDHVRDHRSAANGSNSVDAAVVIVFGDCACRSWSNR